MDEKLIIKEEDKAEDISRGSNLHESRQSIFESSWLQLQESFERLKKNEYFNDLEEGEESKQFSKKFISVNANESKISKTVKRKDNNESKLTNIKSRKSNWTKKSKKVENQNKVASADIKEWKEHKLHITSFMEHLKSLFVNKENDDISYSFGDYLSKPEDIRCDITNLEENDINFSKMNETLKSKIDSYGNQMADYYLKRVINR